MARGFRRRLAGVDQHSVEATTQGLALASGVYDVSASDASANSATINTGLTSVSNAIVQVVDGGDNVVTSDADVTITGGNIIVADGATFNVTATYFIRWIATGTYVDNS